MHMLVPETEAERVTGANRGLRSYDGFVFNFVPTTAAIMTMKDTPFPLKIAFVGPDYVVHTIYDAPAHSGYYKSDQLTQWVVEFVEKNALRKGDRIGFAVA
jgi:uncharacterized membrane protein (UPF0127 family)